MREPGFGFAWVRLAELEFSFGNIRSARDALAHGLTLSPRNAEGLALEGFLFAAQNRAREAIEWFNRALEVDPSLGNAWLGRGLCRIRLGDTLGGRDDLITAAAIEPQRAVLRSYLGKADDRAGDYPRAVRDLKRAIDLDANDPTAWLYSALLNQEHNRINQAVRDLEKSQELNDNRAVYRSRLLLDQDRAVRSANLAGIYRDAGMFDWSVREASRAVSYDYANYSAHLFLANSYQQLADPKLINLRYETPAEAEYLLANLLSPPHAGVLSPTISQQEYSRLFERDRLGVASTTEYSSRGNWLESGAQYGIFDGTSYSLEGFYRTENGDRPNNDLEQRQLSVLLKQRLTPKDTVFLQATTLDSSGGDLFQYLNQAGASRVFRFREKQEPILTLGYHREWSPGIHTLFLAARIEDRFSLTNAFGPTLFARHYEQTYNYISGTTTAEQLMSEPEIYTAELQQILQLGAHRTILGARVQLGDFGTTFQGSPSATFNAAVPDRTLQAIDPRFERLSLYAYHSWEVADWLQLAGGLTYDVLTFPENFRNPPLSRQAKEDPAGVPEDRAAPDANAEQRTALRVHPFALRRQPRPEFPVGAVSRRRLPAVFPQHYARVSCRRRCWGPF